mgnify:CR=1 FL=1
MQIYKQRIADLQYLVIVSIENYLLLITQERLVKMKFRKSILLYWMFKPGKSVILSTVDVHSLFSNE